MHAAISREVPFLDCATNMVSVLLREVPGATEYNGSHPWHAYHISIPQYPESMVWESIFEFY
jgi:hypothetical protein